MLPPTARQAKASKLSLDLTNLPSFNGTQNNQLSPIYNGMTSPTTAVSEAQYANKTHAELMVILKERERDISLAAEIGKSLLENNIALKSKYDTMVTQLQNIRHRKRQQSGYGRRTGDRTGIPRIAPPSNSLGGLETFPEESSDWMDDSDTESMNGYSSGLEMPSPSLKTRSRSPARGGFTQKDFEHLRELEMANIELQAQLDALLNEKQEMEKTQKAKVRKLEADFAHLQEVCSEASEKIELLEQDNNRLKEKQSTDFWNLRTTQKSSDNDNEEVIDRLLNKVKELEENVHTIERTKSDLDKRLKRATKELDTLRPQYEALIQTSKDYVDLQQRYEKQEIHIVELAMALEEQRNLNLGMRSSTNSRAGSFSEHMLRRLSDPAALLTLRGTTPANAGQSGKVVKRSLLDELESQWYRDVFQGDNRKRDSKGTPPFSPVMSETDLSDFYSRSAAMSEAEDDILSAMEYMSEDEFTFLDTFKEDDEKAMLRREWFFRRWARAIYRFLRAIWRWCRFLVLICAAVVMALYRGPDDVLPDDM
ncbi:403_t:CDS:2 [Ambispora gerdemannii]|uniref:403_t:CDS:1 n=1 Tax=Ambispora gerdemannii TaxID=144530 RepID=A0A9N8Z6J2_9GLOM|nr:403_t:CDS:2 [Ambispora gerdemannii]